jgi:uncharacterized protein YjiK
MHAPGACRRTASPFLEIAIMSFRPISIAALMAWLGLASAAPQAAEDGATAPCARMDADGSGQPALRFVGQTALSYAADRSLAELSGLVIQSDPSAPGGLWFWTVADEESALFRISRSGVMERRVELGADFAENLEGVAFAGGRLLAVREDPAAVVSVEADDLSGAGKRIAQLADMEGFGSTSDPEDASGTTLEAYVEASDDGDMLEGIAVDSKNDRIFLLKEKHPSLLIEVTGDLGKIRSMTVLFCGKAKECSESAVFEDVADDIDFSDIAYDSRREKLWLLSDKLSAVFLYDPKSRAFTAYPLKTPDGMCINKPEGVAILDSPDGKGTSLFVINDNKTLKNSLIFEYALDDAPGAR